MNIRKIRGKSQKIFLVETYETVNDNERKYDVMGTTGNVYTVTITLKPECTCPDFILRHNNCKHIYFILTRVMQIDNKYDDLDKFTDKELKIMFSNIREITNNLKVSNNVKDKYLQLKKNTKIEMRNTEDFCAICLDELNNDEELDYCKYSCGKAVHKACFDIYNKYKTDIHCIFCRSKWKQEENSYINIGY